MDPSTIKRRTRVVALIMGLGLAGLGIVGLAAEPAAAQTTTGATESQVIVDNLFILICGVLVLLLQAGFAMVKSGLARAKNAAHIVVKSLFDVVVAAIGFALIGYHIAYSGSDWLGFRWAWGGPVDVAPGAPNLTMAVHIFFTMGFAAVAATIVSGALAERIRFPAYFIYATFISSIVYPVVVSWVWGGGWLTKMSTPFIDFAGSSVVHVTGGSAALIGAMILGPRIGRFDDDDDSLPIPGHNIVLATLGVFVVLIGWFGLSAGSLLAADLQMGMIVTLTAIGAATGGIGATIASWLTIKTPDVTLIGNGVLGGLVGISAGVANLSLFGAMIVGLIAGIITANGVLLVDRHRIDDPAGAIPVHLFCGLWGTIALGFLADPDATANSDGPAGLLYGGGLAQLVSQLTGTIAIVTFVGATVGTMFLVMRSLDMLRVSPDVEASGLDLAEHATPAYNHDLVDYDRAKDRDPKDRDPKDRAAKDRAAKDRAELDEVLEELSSL